MADRQFFDGVSREVLDTVPLVIHFLRAEMRAHRGPDLSVPQFRTLGFLRRHPGASLSDAAEHVGLTLPSMSKLVDGLVARGSIIRMPSASDRRRVQLNLSRSGTSHLKAMRNEVQARLAERLAPLSGAEKSTVKAAMRILRVVLENRGNGADARGGSSRR